MEGVFNHLTSSLSLKPSRQVTLRFLIHCCCMVERIVINRKPLQMALESQPNLDARAFSVIKSAFLAHRRRLRHPFIGCGIFLYLRTAL
ncbi:NtrC family transcriptional regulator [Salmonella enterica subsp. enterica]|uniref:NtrC family transcriptional regulator n=1 Tax=Salmonella enterica I TaxID=59201 RepID=A0A3S4HUB5_SALET|nr:NtrC family transcriptional regulator [Salmonella enterica subsp. enterica]